MSKEERDDLDIWFEAGSAILKAFNADVDIAIKTQWRIIIICVGGGILLIAIIIIICCSVKAHNRKKRL
jgi:uncharacterized membrane protein YozB (DUF420 family)